MIELSLIKYYLTGGILMHPIFIIMVVSTAWTIKQYLNLSYNFTLNENFFNKIKFLVKDGRVHEAYQHCLTTSHPVSKIFAAILYNSNRNKDVIESALIIEKQKVLPYIKNGSKNIYRSAQLVLLLGAIGVFQALAHSFASMPLSNIAEQVFYMTRGISSGMYVGIFSCFVAFQCLVFYSYLSQKEKKIFMRYQEIISEVAHLVIYKQYSEIVNDNTTSNEYRRYGT